MADNRIVVLGARGFVGSNLVKYITLPDIIGGDLGEVDITEPSSVSRFLQAGDVVINAAGYASATDTSAKGDELFQRINVDGLRNIADACASVGVAQLIHISSVAAMGRVHGECIDESTCVPVKSPYAKSKIDGEILLKDYFDRIPITILRPTSVFGENRGLARTLCSIISKGILPLPGGGKAKIPFTYIGNIAKCVELAIGNSSCFGKTFIIGDDHAYEFREIALKLAQALKTEPRVIDVPVSLALAGVVLIEGVCRLFVRPPLMDRGRLETLTSTVSFSIESFKLATGYNPPYSLDESLTRIASWYKETSTNNE